MNKEILNQLDLDKLETFFVYYETVSGKPKKPIFLSECFDDLEFWSKNGFDFNFEQVKRGLNYLAIDCLDHIKFISAKEANSIFQKEEIFGTFFHNWQISEQCPIEKKWVINKLYAFINSHSGRFPFGNVNHIIDYIRSFPFERLYIKNHNNNKEVIENKLKVLEHEFQSIPKLSYKEILHRANLWTEKLNKRAQQEEDWAGIKEVYSFNDGFKVYELFSEKALEREGFLMNHCVASYFNHDSKIYSLRDTNNNPLVTIEYDTHNESIEQIKGKNNDIIKKEHAHYIYAFLSKKIPNFKYADLDGLEPFIVKFIWDNDYTNNICGIFLKKDSIKEDIYLSKYLGKPLDYINEITENSPVGFKEALSKALSSAGIQIEPTTSCLIGEDQIDDFKFFLKSIKTYDKYDEFIPVLKDTMLDIHYHSFFDTGEYEKIFGEFLELNYPDSYFRKLLETNKKETLKKELKKYKKLISNTNVSLCPFKLRSFYFKKPYKSNKELISSIPQNSKIYKLLTHLENFSNYNGPVYNNYYDEVYIDRPWELEYVHHTVDKMLDGIFEMVNNIHSTIQIAYENTFNPYVYRKHNLNLNYNFGNLKVRHILLTDTIDELSTPDFCYLDESFIDEYYSLVVSFEKFKRNEENFLKPLHKYWKSRSL